MQENQHNSRGVHELVLVRTRCAEKYYINCFFKEVAKWKRNAKVQKWQ